MEYDQIGFNKHETFLANKFESVLGELAQCKTTAKSLAIIHNELRATGF